VAKKNRDGVLKIKSHLTFFLKFWGFRIIGKEIFQNLQPQNPKCAIILKEINNPKTPFFAKLLFITQPLKTKNR